jgi:transcription initiation factor TFIID subunit 1
MDDDDISVTGSMSSNYHVNNQNKYLMIKRLITQKNGEKSWQQELIKDPVVIKSYLRLRQMIEEEARSAEALGLNDSEAKNARMKKLTQDQLSKLKRTAERRRQRELAKQAALAENPVLGLIRGKREGAMVSFFIVNLPFC